MHDRRRYPRMALDVEVGLGSENNFFVARTRDISVGGLYVVTPSTLAPGSSLVVNLHLEGEAHHLHCKVAWATTLPDGTGCGLGLEFDRLPVPAQRAIERMMVRRPPDVVEEFLPEPLPAPKAVPRPRKHPPPLPS